MYIPNCFQKKIVGYFSKLFFSCLLCLMLAGCMKPHDYAPPEVDMPVCWNSETTSGMQNSSIDGFIWWQALNDPLLDSLIDRAKFQNPDLYMAAMRILQAREGLKGDEAGYLPRIDASISDDYVRFNQKTLNRILDVHSGHKTRQFNLFEVGFDAEWEIDLFGANANKIKALKNLAEASEEEFRQIELTLAAEVAKNYIELRGWQLKLQLIEKQIEIQSETFSLVSGLGAAGFISDIEELKSRKQRNFLLAKIPDLEFMIKKAVHRISVLLGYAPDILFAELMPIQSLPELPCRKPIGVPSELLRNRPDIRKAEKELASSLALVDSAIAELFPRISLKGFIGDFSALGSNSLTVLAGPKLFLPIFNSKMLTQGVQVNKLKVKEVCYAYQKTVLEALEEVENSLSSFNAESIKYDHYYQVLKASRDIFEATSQLYQRGFKDYQEVLDARQSLLDSQLIFDQTYIDLLIRYVALYKSLGGGWCEEWDSDDQKQ